MEAALRCGGGLLFAYPLHGDAASERVRMVQSAVSRGRAVGRWSLAALSKQDVR